MSLASRVLLPQTGHLDGLLAGILVGAAFAMVRYISRRPDELLAAIACDQAAGTPELFSSAWTLPPSGGSDPAWQQTILAHARHALTRVDVNTMFRGWAHPGRPLVGLMLLLSAALWHGQTPPSHTQHAGAQSHADGQFAPLDTRTQTPGIIGWPGAAPRSGSSAGETSRTAGPELLTPANAAAQLGRNARQLGEESGGNAMAGRGNGGGLAKGSPPNPIDMLPAGKGTPAGAGADLTSGDGATSLIGGNARATSGGQVVTDASRATGEPSVGGNPPAAAGPTAARIASIPARYRAAVREYFNR